MSPAVEAAPRTLPPLPDETNVLRIYGGLVRNLASRFVRYDRTLDRDDLQQVGLITLLNCLKTYDPDLTNPKTGIRYSFSAYAGRSIHSQMKRHADRLAKGGIANMGTHERGRVLPRTFNSLHGLQYAEQLGEGWSAAVEEDNDLLVDDPGPDLVDNDEMWPIAQSVLDHREYWVLWSVYAQDQTDAQVARWLGLSKMRVGQIRKAALEKLRPHLTEFA